MSVSYIKPEPAEIVFHFPCNDGITAAAIAKLFSIHHGVSFNFHPMKAGETPKGVLELKDTTVIFIDCAPTSSEIQTLSAKGNNVTVIDHHKIACEELLHAVGNFTAKFDMKASGASLAFRYFQADKFYHNVTGLTKFVSLVEAKDLNLDSLKPESDHLFFGLAERCKQVRDPLMQIDVVIQAFSELDKLIDEGARIAIKKEIDILTAVNNGKRVFITDIESPIIATEIGEAVMEKYPEIDYVMMKYEGVDQNGEGVTNVSLRSKREDVGVIAQKEGGGGHSLAAGYFYKTKKHKV